MNYKIVEQVSRKKKSMSGVLRVVMIVFAVLFVVMGGVFEGSTERKNLLLLKKQTPSNAVECVLGLVDLLR